MVLIGPHRRCQLGGEHQQRQPRRRPTRVIPRRHGNHPVRRSRQIFQALPVPLHHATSGGSFLPLQRGGHQRDRLGEPP